MREFLLRQRRRGGSSGSIGALAQRWRHLQRRISTSAHQSSGQRHSGAAAVSNGSGSGSGSGQRAAGSGAAAAVQGR